MKKEKNPIIKIWNKTFERIPIKTHIIMKDDNIFDVAKKYTKDLIKKDDVVFITEKIVAITQGRAIPLKDIKPRKLAYFLAKYVQKTPAWIGLGMPETMEMALREVWTCRIFFAAAMSAITKIFWKKWVFYNIAWYKARSIDWPTPNTIPPYNEYVVLGPENPDKVAKEVSEKIWAKVIISDINDLWGNILWVSEKSLYKNLYTNILKDNPLWQDHEQTPIWIIREVSC